MRTSSRLGPNVSEMEVKTFVRIQQVIHKDQLLASEAEFIQKVILLICSVSILCLSVALCQDFFFLLF